MAIFSCCTEVELAKDNYQEKLNERKLNNDNKINKEKHKNKDKKKKTNNEKKKKSYNKEKDKPSNHSKNNKLKEKKSEFKKKKINHPKNKENAMAPETNVLELKDNQWDVSHYKDSGTVKLNKVEINNSVNIFKSENTTFIIENNKFKSLQIQKCEKCNIILNNLISSIEIIDSKKIKIQVLGKCSSVAIDKCIGINIYLSKENVETEFTTALSAEMNVHLENEDNGWQEITIPEQFQHNLENGKLNTRVSDLYKF